MAGFMTTRSYCKTSKHKKGHVLTLVSCYYAASNRKSRFCEFRPGFIVIHAYTESFKKGHVISYVILHL